MSFVVRGPFVMSSRIAGVGQVVRYKEELRAGPALARRP